MDPYAQQPQHSLQPPTTNPYEFILNPQKPPKKNPLFSLRNGSLAGMIVLIVGGAFLLMIILAIVATLLGGNKTNVADFVSVAQSQQELIRVANQGTTGATQQTTKNLAVSAEYALRTQQQQVMTYLANNGKELNEEELVFKQNAQTDLQFKTAKATSTFDLVFAKVMQNELTAYANSLEQLSKTSDDSLEREMLGAYFEQAQMLISQIPYTQESIESLQ